MPPEERVGPPPQQPTDDAQTHYQRAETHYSDEQYRDAIAEFHKSFHLQPHPITLYNMAMAHRQLNEIDDAARLARHASAMDEPLPDRQHATAHSFIATDTVLSRAEQTAAAIDALPEVDDTDEPGEPTEPIVVDDDDEFPIGPLGWAGITGLGLSAAALGTTAFINAEVQHRRDQLEELADDLSDEAMDQHLDEVSAWQVRGRILLFSGIGLAAVGGGLLVWDLLDEDDDQPDLAVAPTVGRPGVQMSLQW